MNDLFFRFLLILAAAALFERVTRWGIMRYLRNHGDDQENATVIKFFGNGLTLFVITAVSFATVASVPMLRTFALSLTAGAGLIAAAFALASQAALADIVNGIFIVLSKPFRVNDRIIFGNSYEGYVEDITLRHTVIRDFEHKRIVIPNSVIAKDTIINSTLNESICRFFEVPVSYRADAEVVIAMIKEEVQAHPNYMDVRTRAERDSGKLPVTVRMVQFASTHLLLRTYLWGEPDTTFYMACDLRRTLLKRLRDEGIELPVPFSKLEISGGEVAYKEDAPHQVTATL